MGKFSGRKSDPSWVIERLAIVLDAAEKAAVDRTVGKAATDISVR